MKDGFGLVEIMLAILIVCIVSASAVKLLLATSQAGIDSSTRTYASILANSKLASMKSCPLNEDQIAQGWHADKENPIVNDRKHFYRYWTVLLNDNGSRTMTVYVKWNSSGGDLVVSSKEEMDSVSCSGVEHVGIRDAFMQ